MLRKRCEARKGAGALEVKPTASGIRSEMTKQTRSTGQGESHENRFKAGADVRISRKGHQSIVTVYKVKQLSSEKEYLKRKEVGEEEERRKTFP